MSITFAEVQAEYNAVLTTLAEHLGFADDQKTDPAHYLELATKSRLHRANQWFISGISGSGKSTVTKLLEENGYAKIPNVTTRARRQSERENDYVFTDSPTFQAWEAEGKLFHPHDRNGVRHAVLLSDIDRLRGSERVYMDKSISSTRTIVDEMPQLQSACFVYLLAPSLETLYARIKTREQQNLNGGMDDSKIIRRFDEEIRDMARASELPYTFIINDEMQRVEAALKPFLT